ncbi:MAG TPA: hypothetical protein VLB27_05490, partial [candidate division Zixibacteria bacterium]|nr:hypothetical protein [candidate division Zixibacteria bacterium]
MTSANNCGAPRWFAVCAAVALAAAPLSAQTPATDTTGVSPDSAADSADVDYPVEIVTGDSAQTLFAIPLEREEEPDSLPRYTPFRFSAALERRLLHHSQSRRDLMQRSFHHDAGDFFRGDRAFFTVDYQATPVRHTVSPYTLPGPRFAAIFNGQPLNPVEHLTEQDAALDFNDVPTASVGDVYMLHGPEAAFLGGASGIAGAWLKKVTPAGEIPESRLEAQKGAYGYAYTKGVITETTASGFSYTAALGYRQAKYNLLRR